MPETSNRVASSWRLLLLALWLLSFLPLFLTLRSAWLFPHRRDGDTLGAPQRDTEGIASDTAVHAVLGKFLLIRHGEVRFAVKFTALTDRADGGAKYEWYSQSDPKARFTEQPQESGDGEVFEKYRRVGQHGDSTLVENDGGELHLRLGPVQLEWSRRLTVYFPQPWELTPEVEMALTPWQRVEDIDFDSGLLRWHKRSADPNQPDPKKLLSRAERDAIVTLRQRGVRVAINPEKDGRVFIWVSLRGPGVTDADLDTVARLEHLGELDVGSSAVTDTGLKKLEGLKALEDLDLSATRVTGKGLASLAGLTVLKRLEV